MKVEIIQAQREIIQGYYNRIFTQQPSNETILQWLEDDLQTLSIETFVSDVEKIINNHEN